MKKNNMIIAVRTVSDFEQGYVSSVMSKFNLTIVERKRNWIVFERRVGLIQASKILTFLRQNHWEFIIKGES